MGVGATGARRTVIRRAERDAILSSIGNWGFFAVLLSLIPILANLADALTVDDKNFHFEALIHRGELLIVSTAILGAALAELFAHEAKPRYRKMRKASGCWAGLVLLAASVWFAAIAADVRNAAVP